MSPDSSSLRRSVFSDECLHLRCVVVVGRRQKPLGGRAEAAKKKKSEVMIGDPAQAADFYRTTHGDTFTAPTLTEPAPSATFASPQNIIPTDYLTTGAHRRVALTAVQFHLTLTFNLQFIFGFSFSLFYIFCKIVCIQYRYWKGLKCLYDSITCRVAILKIRCTIII